MSGISSSICSMIFSVALAISLAASRFACSSSSSIVTSSIALADSGSPFYARARGSRHQGEYILVVVVIVVFVVPFVKIKKNP